MSKFLISVVGPTAIGKTSLSVKLAQYFGASIISADSRQFFKEMTIGTAVPTEEELSQATHYFIQNKSIKTPYDVGSFEKEAILKLKTMFLSNDVAIMVGGSGLYLDAVTKGLNDFPKVEPHIRVDLNHRLESDGLQDLQRQLKTLDPETYNNIDIQNPHRVIRALEVSISTGKPFSSFIKKPKKARTFKTISIGLTANRELIYERINDRVEMMMRQGLLEEARMLYDYKNLSALNTVGYKELFKYLDGEWTLEFAISEIKKNTRRFAKRQMTWFRKDNTIHWFDHDAETKEIIKLIKDEIDKKNYH